MPAIILSALQLLFLAVLAPALSWFIKKMKAASQNRVGPDLVQVYSDLLKLFRKNMVISETASWVFHVMPFVLFASTLAAASMLPVLGAHSLFGFTGGCDPLCLSPGLGPFLFDTCGIRYRYHIRRYGFKPGNGAFFARRTGASSRIFLFRFSRPHFVPGGDCFLFRFRISHSDAVFHEPCFWLVVNRNDC